MNTSKQARKIKLSVYAVGAALSVLSAQNLQAATEPAASPYSTTPLHFKTTTSSSAKPNIMLLLDDSGSMNGREIKYVGWPREGGKSYIYKYNTSYLFVNKQNRSLKDQHRSCQLHNGKFFSGDVNFFNDNTGTWTTMNLTPNGICYVKKKDRGSIFYERYGTGWMKERSWEQYSDSNGFQYISKTKLEILKDTLNQLLDDPQSKNYWWGVELLNHWQNSLPLQELTDVYKQDLKQFINDLSASGGTPMTQRYYDVVIQRRNRSGQNIIKTGFVDQIKYRCQPNHIIVLSDGASNGLINLNAIDYFFKDKSGYNDWTIYSEWGINIPYPNANGANGLAYLSKQFHTLDLKSNVPYQAYAYPATNYYTPNRTTVDEDGVSWDDQAFPPQTITTHTIAFGEDVLNDPIAKAYLENGAKAGGGIYKEAKNADELFVAFGEILKTRAKPFVGYSSVAPAVISTDVAGVAATATLDSQDWRSELRFYRLDANGNATKKSDGKDLTQNADFPGLSDSTHHRRVVLTRKNGTAYTTDFFDDASAGIGNADVDIASTRPNSTSASEQEWAKTFIPWLARYSSLKDSVIDADAKSYGLRYRVRGKDGVNDAKRQMGDVIGAPVLAMGKRVLAGTDSKGNRDYKHEFLVAAANDGMLHIFKAQAAQGQNVDSADFKPYSLAADYIPGAIERTSPNDTILKNLKWQTHPDYGKNNGNDAEHRHIYLLNGGMASRTTDGKNSGNRQTFVVGNAGQGGKGVFAVNISGKNRATGDAVGVDAGLNNLNTSLPLWLDTGGDLGYTISTPAIGRVATKWNEADQTKQIPASANLNEGVRYGAFIANGYDGKGTSALYIYDALGQEVGLDGAGYSPASQGALMKKLSVPTVAGDTNPSLEGKGLSSPTAVDTNRDGVVDVVYAGDYTGNLYRFDLRGGIGNWKVTRIFTGSHNQPITTAPSVKPYGKSSEKYVVMFGTGSDIYDQDLNNNSVQTFYGIYDDLAEPNPTAAKKVDLIQQQLEIDEKNSQVRQIKLKTAEELEIDKTKQKGWYIDLVNSSAEKDKKGERVTTKASVLGETVFFSTRTYLSESDNAQKVCTSSSSSGYSWLMAVNADNGGRLTRKNTRFGTLTGVSYPFHAGVRLSGILSPLSDSFSSYIDKHEIGNADAGYGPTSLADNNEVGNGADSDLGEENNQRPRRLVCGTSQGSHSLYYTASDTGFGKMGIQARDCPDPRRISWREIF